MSNPCVIPTEVIDSQGDGRWMSQHKRNLAEGLEREPEVILIGDTIIHCLMLRPIWADLFEPLHCLNFGISGDKIENVLWRINDGVLDNVKPKAVVVQAGTNNTSNTPEQISSGILEIANVIHSKLPETNIIICHLRIKRESLTKEADVVFLGDSIIAHLHGTGVWNDLFTPLHSLNFGIGGDRTEHVLWRIKDGIFANIQPKAVVVHIGTNNNDRAPNQVGEGILEIVRHLQKTLPKAHVIVTSLLPRGEHANPLRTFVSEVNRYVEDKLNTLGNGERSTFIDISSDLLQPDGTLNFADSPDYLHLSDAGYKKTFSKVHGPLLKILKETL